MPIYTLGEGPPPPCGNEEASNKSEMSSLRFLTSKYSWIFAESGREDSLVWMDERPKVTSIFQSLVLDA